MGKNLPRGITMRGGKYRVSIMVDGVRRTGTEATLEEAIRLAEGLRTGTDEVTAQRTSPWTYGVACERVIEDHVKVNATSERSIWSRSSNLRQVAEYFGPDVRLDLTTGAEVDEWRRHLKTDRGLSPNYINVLLSAFQQMHRHALRHGGKVKPLIDVSYVPQKKGRIRFLTREEETRMLDWCDHTLHQTLRDFIVLAVDTGLRIEEACQLTFKDCDMQTGKLHVWVSKSKQPRAVQMTKRVQQLIRTRPQFLGCDLVLGGITQKTLRDHWNVMREALGMANDPQFVPHVLRHTCCTRLVSAGIDLRTVQTWMGHENIKTTMGYAQFVPENMFKAAAALEQDSKPDLRVVKGGSE